MRVCLSQGESHQPHIPYFKKSAVVSPLYNPIYNLCVHVFVSNLHGWRMAANIILVLWVAAGFGPAAVLWDRQQGQQRLQSPQVEQETFLWQRAWQHTARPSSLLLPVIDGRISSAFTFGSLLDFQITEKYVFTYSLWITEWKLGKKGQPHTFEIKSTTR